MNKQPITFKSGILIALIGFVVCWIGLIFYFSSQPIKESLAQSGEVVSIYEKINDVFDISDSAIFGRIERFVFEDVLGNRYKTTDAKVRKTAHFGIYFVLGVGASFTALRYVKKWPIGLIIGITLPTTVAVLDEFNQGLGDRTSSLSDVVLDGSGAMLGTLIVLLVYGVTKCVMRARTKR